MLGGNLGISIFLFVSLLGRMNGNTVFPIDLGEFDSVSFNNFELLQNLLYRKTLEPKHVLQLTFSNIKMGSSKLQVFTQLNGKFTIERNITGTTDETIRTTLHSVDNAGVFVPKSTGTFRLNYWYKKSCGQYCAVDAVTEQPIIACGDIPYNHQQACIECKASRCFVASVSPHVEEDPILFGVTYCPFTPNAERFGCTDGRAVGSTCSFSCGGNNIPGTPGVTVIKSTCKLVSEGIGEWENFPENFCLSQQQFLEICLSTDSNLGACKHDVNSKTENFGEEPPTTTPATTTIKHQSVSLLAKILDEIASLLEKLQRYLERN